MTIHRHVSYTIEHGDFELEVTYQPVEDNSEVVVEVGDGRIVVGYLSHDPDCENPLDDSDGRGEIIRRYHGNREEKLRFNEELGLDEYGDQDEKRNPLAVLLDVYDHSGEYWSIHGTGMNDRWDTTKGAGVWVPDKSCIEHIMYTAIKGLLPEGISVEYKSKRNADGTVDDKNLNIITYTLPDGTTKGGYKTFETAIRAAARKWGVKLDRAAIMAGAYREAVVCAKQALETYNDWLSGSCYGVCVDVMNADGQPLEDGDACWGFVGQKWAEESLKEEVKSKVEYLKDHPYREPDAPGQQQLF